MSKLYSNDIFGDTTPNFIPTNDFYAFNEPGKKKSKKGKKAHKREKKLAKKLKKARKVIKAQERLICGNCSSASTTWWQTVLVESLPKVIDLINTTKGKK